MVFQLLAGTVSELFFRNTESASGRVSGAELPGRFQVSLPRAVMLNESVGKNTAHTAGSSGCVPRPCAAPWLREGGNLMNAAMYAARILYHSDIPCISCVCGSVRLCCPRPVGSQVPSALQEGLASTATHPTRGCAFSGRIRRVDTAARRLSAKVADIRVQARATGLRYVNIGCYDGSAKTLPASCTNLAVFLRWHMFGQCVRLCGCAGCAWPSHSTS